MRRLNRLLITLILLATGPIARAEADIHYDAASRLTALLGQINTLTTPISQTVLAADGAVLQQLTGELMVARPNMFRIETGDPLPQVLVSDGNKLWNYDPDLEQLIISRLNQDIGEVPILILSGDKDQLAEQFAIEHFETEDSDEFVLIPHEETSLFSRIQISFRAESPRQITIVDGFQQQTRIHFDQVKLNQPLQSEAFSFKAPPGADVVDDT